MGNLSDVVRQALVASWGSTQLLSMLRSGLEGSRSEFFRSDAGTFVALALSL